MRERRRLALQVSTLNPRLNSGSPLPREARKFLIFIKSLEKEDNVVSPPSRAKRGSFYVSLKIRITVLASESSSEFRFPTPARRAEALTFHKIMRERRRFAVPFSILNPCLNSVSPPPPLLSEALTFH